MDLNLTLSAVRGCRKRDEPNPDFKVIPRVDDA
jgi:hypothetical protein